jgi:tetratricopeptide (TPR) repeat protein
MRLSSALETLSRLSLLFLVLFAAFGATPLWAQGDPLDGLFGDQEESAPTLPEEAGALSRELIRRSLYDRALTVCNEMLKAQPGDVDWLLRRSEIHWIRGELSAPTQALDEALKKEPLNVDLLEMRGRFAERSGELDAAMAFYAKAIAQNPGAIPSLRAALALGWLYLDKGLRPDAEQCWLSLLDFYDKAADPSAEELRIIGLGCIGLDLCPEAKKRFAKPMFKYAQLMFDQSIAKDPRQVDTWVAYGQAYADKFNFADARKVIQRALEIARFNPFVRVALARALLSSYELGHRRFELARYHLNEAMSVQPLMPEALAVQAEMELSEGRPVEALKIIRRGLKVHKHQVELRAAAAAAAVFRGRDKELESHWQAVKTFRPGCARFFASVAETVGSRFRYLEARELAKRALTIDKDYHPALATLGINLARTGEGAEAFKVLDLAQRADPFHVYVFNTLQILTKVNDPKQYQTFTSAHIELKLPAEEAATAPFIMDLLERAYRELGEKYGAVPPKVFVEFFSTIEDFSARSIGLPFIGALGVCFGNTMTILSAREKRLGENSWGKTLWHEFTHVVTLTRTRNRVPRWLTEGLAVFEESRGHPNWVRENDRALLTARRGDLILPLAEFDAGFHRPKFGGQVMMSYFQGGLISEFIADHYGFKKVLDLLDAFAAGLPQDRAVRRAFSLSEAEFDKAFLEWMDRRYAGIPQSVLAPDPFTQMLQGVVLEREKEALRSELREEPWNLVARGRLARVYALLGNTADAQTLANDIDERAGLGLEALVKEQSAAMSLGNPASAESLARSLAELRRARGEASLARAQLALSANRPEEAETGFLRALELGSGDPALVRSSLAQLAMRRDDYKSAVDHLQALARLIPPEARVHRDLRICYLKLDDQQRALEELIKVCLYDSSDLKARLKAGEKLYAQRRWRELARVLSDVLYLDPFQPLASFQLAEALRFEDRAADSLAAYEVALKTGFPERERCLLGLALCQRSLGKKDEARDSARKALELDSSLEEAKKLLDELDAPK